MTISRRILLRIRNVSERICKANQNTHFVLKKYLSENRAICDKVRKNMAQPDRLQMRK